MSRPGRSKGPDAATVDSLGSLNIGLRIIYSSNPLVNAAKTVLSAFYSPFYGAFDGKPLVNERLAEIPFAISSLGNARRILDVGSAESLLPIQLASAGWEVWTIDPRGYPFSHRSLHRITGDAAAMPFEPESFDAVLAISTMEHIGIGYSEVQSRDKDLLASKEIQRVLKRDGRFIITLPFGPKPSSDSFQRVYDSERLQALLSGFRVVNSQYLLCQPRSGVFPVSEESAKATTFDYPRSYCVAEICCVKSTNGSSSI